MSIYYNDYGRKKTKRKTNSGANGQFAQIVKDVESFPYNIPLPPMNPDGSFKSVDQLVNESKMSEWEKQKSDDALIANRDFQSSNDPEQIAWEREQRWIGKSKPKNSFGKKVLVFFVLCVALVLAGLTGSDIVLYIVGFPVIFGGIAYLFGGM